MKFKNLLNSEKYKFSFSNSRSEDCHEREKEEESLGWTGSRVSCIIIIIKRMKLFMLGEKKNENCVYVEAGKLHENSLWSFNANPPSPNGLDSHSTIIFQFSIFFLVVVNWDESWKTFMSLNKMKLKMYRVESGCAGITHTKASSLSWSEKKNVAREFSEFSMAMKKLIKNVNPCVTQFFVGFLVSRDWAAKNPKNWNSKCVPLVLFMSFLLGNVVPVKPLKMWSEVLRK